MSLLHLSNSLYLYWAESRWTNYFGIQLKLKQLMKSDQRFCIPDSWVLSNSTDLSDRESNRFKDGLEGQKVNTFYQYQLTKCNKLAFNSIGRKEWISERSSRKVLEIYLELASFYQIEFPRVGERSWMLDCWKESLGK